MNGYEEADRLTDAELERLERELERIYREAAEDMQKEISDYFTSFAKREKQYRAMVEAGTMTEEEFTRWRLGAIGRGERMKALRDKLAERMTQANEEAAAMMNRAMPGIFVLNGNYTAYEIFGGEGIDWTLWNEEAVRRIIRDDPDLMPYYPAERAVRRGIDLDWGRRQITAQVISSILLGDSLGTIAEKLMRRIEGMNATSAKRTARTAVTEAQNAGRQSVFEMAAELGIKLHRRWVATKDLRTRHAHAMADHQIVAVDEPFTVGGEKIMFPGSGSLGASGWNLYNCRCTVVSSEKEGIEAEPRMMRVWDPVKGEWVLMEDVSYSQWYEAMKAKHGESAMEAALKMAKYRTSDREQYERYKAVLGKRAPGSFADFQDLKYKTPAEWEAMKRRYWEATHENNGGKPAEEREYRGENRSMEANEECISSQKYRQRYRGLTANSVVDDIICRYARESIRAKSGQKEEILTLIDADTGQRVAQKDDNEKGRINYTEEFEEKIAQAHREGRRLIAIHNHPESYPPSADDCASALDHGYMFGIAACHDGKIYVYEPSQRSYTTEECARIHSYIAAQILEEKDIDIIWPEMLQLYKMTYYER